MKFRLLLLTFILLLTAEAVADKMLQDPNSYRVWNAKLWDVKSARLQALMNSKDPTTAVAAAWEKLVVRTTPHDRKTQIGLQRANIFCGFIEKRLEVSLPAWFRTTLAAGRLSQRKGHRRSQLTTPGPVDLKVFKSYKKVSTRYITIRSLQTITVKDDQLVLGQGSGAIKIPTKDMIQPGTKGTPQIKIAHLSEKTDHWYTQDYGDFEQLKLKCQSIRGLKWNGSVWRQVGYQANMISGSFFHVDGIVTNKSSVFVVGIHDTGIYASGFDKLTGKPRFRLVTDLASDDLDLEGLEIIPGALKK